MNAVTLYSGVTIALFCLMLPLALFLDGPGVLEALDDAYFTGYSAWTKIGDVLVRETKRDEKPRR